MSADWVTIMYNSNVQDIEKRKILCGSKGEGGGCEKSDGSIWPPTIFFLANFVAGMGGSLYYTLGVSYMDDNIQKAKTPALISEYQTIICWTMLIFRLLDAFTAPVAKSQNEFWANEPQTWYTTVHSSLINNGFNETMELTTRGLRHETNHGFVFLIPPKIYFLVRLATLSSSVYPGLTTVVSIVKLHVLTYIYIVVSTYPCVFSLIILILICGLSWSWAQTSSY